MYKCPICNQEYENTNEVVNCVTKCAAEIESKTKIKQELIIAKEAIDAAAEQLQEAINNYNKISETEKYVFALITENVFSKEGKSSSENEINITKKTYDNTCNINQDINISTEHIRKNNIKPSDSSELIEKYRKMCSKLESGSCERKKAEKMLADIIQIYDSLNKTEQNTVEQLLSYAFSMPINFNSITNVLEGLFNV